ncbi:hypothetical protein OSK46_22390, partial [Escherichia coli]|nr:hypothetical protein [Escherichia coli]
SLKTSIKTITYLSDTGCLEIQGASLVQNADDSCIPDGYIRYGYLDGLFDSIAILNRCQQ